jgi:D-alanine transaminase
MKSVAFINSKFIKFNEAKIHIEDRGLQFADSVYEVIAVVNKSLLDLRFHLKRLRYSLKELEIKYKFTENQLSKIFKKLIEKNSVINGIVYLQITRGVQSREHAYKNNLIPTVIIYTKKKKFNLPNKNFKGVKVITHEDYRWARKDIKTTNLLPNILAEYKAYKKKAYSAILIKNNKITEGVHSNIWIVKNNTIKTHPSNTEILKGVTRSTLILIIKKLNLKFFENSFTKNQLFDADEVFLTSSGSFVTPIIKIDSQLINNGKIGKVTFLLAKSYFKAF